MMSKPGSKEHGKSGHLSDRFRQKAPQRYFTFLLLALRHVRYEIGKDPLLKKKRTKQLVWDILD